VKTSYQYNGNPKVVIRSNYTKTIVETIMVIYIKIKSKIKKKNIRVKMKNLQKDEDIKFNRLN
jgi:hypothetical protein